MKINVTLLMLLTFLTVHSQIDKTKLFDQQLNAVSSEYRNTGEEDGMMVQGSLLNERLLKAFNQVVFSSSDLVGNASAFGISQNEEKTNVSVNTNFHLYGEDVHQFYLKAGINANGSGSIFNLYSRDEWKSSVGANAGVIWKFYGSGFTNEGDIKIQQNKVLREIFIRDSIRDNLVNFNKGDYLKKVVAYNNALTNKNKDKITALYKDLEIIEEFFKKLEGYRPKNKKDKLNFKNYSDKQNKINDSIINEIIDIYWTDDKKKDNKVLKKIIKDVAYKYDKKNIKSTGYHFLWADANIGLNNNAFNFSEKAENIESDILTDFNAFDAEKTDINKLNTVISANANYSYNALRGAGYIQLGAKFNSGSFLNSNLINGTAKVSRVDTNGLFFIEDEDGQTLGDFNSIKRDLQYGSFDLYGAYFFGKRKVFGLNISASHRYIIKTPENSFYKENYSILFGPIFRKPKKDDDTGLTFGIDIGFDNAIYETKAGDSFVARIRVGIPFKLYDINK